MTTDNLNVEAVQQMADITQTYTTAIAVVGVFMVIILVAFAASMWEARADRKLERDERDADRKARARLDEVRIKREDENTIYWREAIAKMTDAVSASNDHGGYRKLAVGNLPARYIRQHRQRKDDPDAGAHRNRAGQDFKGKE